MRRALIALFVCTLSALPAYAGTTTWTAVTGSARSCTGTGAAADTFGSGASDGLLLDSVDSFSVYAEADSGQTITTAVQAKAYVQDPYTKRWARAEAYDITGQTVTGVRTVLIGSFKVYGPVGRIAYENNGGAVSSGSLTFRLVATGRGGLL